MFKPFYFVDNHLLEVIISKYLLLLITNIIVTKSYGCLNIEMIKSIGWPKK